MNILPESITPFIKRCGSNKEAIHDFSTIIMSRVWRQEQTIKDDYDNNDLQKYFDDNVEKISLSELAMGLLHFPRVNAVEVTLNGKGIVLYKDWP